MPDNIDAKVEKSKAVAIGDGASARSDEAIQSELLKIAHSNSVVLTELKTGQEAINANMKKMIDEIVKRLDRLEESQAWQWIVIALIAFLSVAIGAGLIWVVSELIGG